MMRWSAAFLVLAACGTDGGAAHDASSDTGVLNSDATTDGPRLDAAMDASGDADSEAGVTFPPNGPLAGTWVYFGDGTATDNPLPEASVVSFLTNVREVGMTTLVLENARTHDGCATKAGDFRWLPEMPQKLGTLLSAASKLGISVYVAGANTPSCSTWTDSPNRDLAAADWKTFAQTMESSYGNESSFTGWYIPDEPWMSTDQHLFYQAVVNAIHSAGSKRPIMVSPSLAFVGPSYPPATVASMASTFRQQTGVDIEAWQDSVGAQGIAAGFVSSTYGSTDSYYAALAGALPNGSLFADVELFTCCVNEFGFAGGNYHPASVSRLNEQLWNARHASVRLSWLLQEDMAGPSVKLAYAESTRLREAYLGLYDLVGHAIKPVGYTWNTAPSTQYPDTNKAELTDSVTGDPLDYQNAAWVGVQGAAEVVFDLGGPKPLRWVAVDLLRSKASGIAYPQSLTVDCDASGSAGFTTLGTWPLPLTSDADGEYVFSNPTALSATCAKIRVHLAGTQWTFLSEIELTGL